MSVLCPFWQSNFKSKRTNHQESWNNMKQLLRQFDIRFMTYPLTPLGFTTTLPTSMAPWLVFQLQGLAIGWVDTTERNWSLLDSQVQQLQRPSSAGCCDKTLNPMVFLGFHLSSMKSTRWKIQVYIYIYVIYHLWRLSLYIYIYQMVSYIVKIGNVRWNWLNEVLRYIATNMQKIDVLSNVKTLNLPKFLKNLNGPHLCFVPWLQGFQHFRVVQWTRGFHTEPPCDAARMEEMGTGQATDQISRDHRLTTDSAGLGFSQILLVNGCETS